MTVGLICYSVGSKIDEPVKEDIIDKSERIPTPVINNHVAVENTDPTFSDDENEGSPVKIIKIDDEEDDIPLGANLLNCFSSNNYWYSSFNENYFYLSVKVKLKEKPTDDAFSDAVKSLDKEIKDIILQLNKEKNNTKRFCRNLISVFVVT